MQESKSLMEDSPSDSPKAPLCLGLTGGIATGKSTVSKMLVEKGFCLVDADLLAREVVEPGQPAFQKIVDHFGAHVLNPDGTLNRPELGKIVFSHRQSLQVLNRITHPRIERLVKARLRDLHEEGHPILLDHPLLFELGHESLVDVVAVVYADPPTQIERLMARNNLSRQEALARIDSQMDLGEKTVKAHYVIDNSGSKEETHRQVDELCRGLFAEAP